MEKLLPDIKVTRLDSTSKQPLQFYLCLHRAPFFWLNHTMLYPHFPPNLFAKKKMHRACWSSGLQGPPGHPWNDPAGSKVSLAEALIAGWRWIIVTNVNHDSHEWSSWYNRYLSVVISVVNPNKSVKLSCLFIILKPILTKMVTILTRYFFSILKWMVFVSD